MANYGRGWGDGYGHQSAESIDDYIECDLAEGRRIQRRNEAESARRNAARLARVADAINGAKRERDK